MCKKILILNGSRSDVPLILAAKKLGFYVITSGNNPDLIGHSFSDKYICVDYSDKEAILKLAQEEKIDSICSAANDFGAITAAYVGEKLGMSGHDPYETALIVHHKNKFKKFAEKHNILTPKAYSFDDEKAALNFAKSYSGKVIIKPIDLGGGKGISVATTTNEKIASIRNAFLCSKAKHIVIEQFIEGQLHSVSTFIINQKVVAYYSNDEFPYIYPYSVASSLGPADDVDTAINIVIQQAEKLASLLQLCDGVLHLQYISGKDRIPYIIEFTRRCPGDLYNYPIERALGFPWTEWLVRAECGFDCSGIPRNTIQQGYTGRYRIMTKKNGIIKSVWISAELKKHCFDQLMWWKPGMEITNYLEEPLGIICYEFDSREEAINVINNIDKYVKVEIQ